MQNQDVPGNVSSPGSHDPLASFSVNGAVFDGRPMPRDRRAAASSTWLTAASRRTRQTVSTEVPVRVRGRYRFVVDVVNTAGEELDIEALVPVYAIPNKSV